MPVAGAGWYDDPEGIHPYRYWDGHEWTAHVVKNPSYVPPFEEWPRMRWGGRGPLRWWWVPPFASVTLFAGLTFENDSYATLAGILASPIVFLVYYRQYRGWRRRADANAHGELGLPR